MKKFHVVLSVGKIMLILFLNKKDVILEHYTKKGQLWTCIYYYTLTNTH